MRYLDFDHPDSLPEAPGLMRANEAFAFVLRGQSLRLFRQLHQAGGALEPLGSELGPLTPLRGLGAAIWLAQAKDYAIGLEEADDQVAVTFGPPVLAASVSRPLPMEVARFLEGGEGEEFPGGEYLLTAHKAREVRDRMQHWCTRGYTPIAADGCGNYYVVIQEGAVAFYENIAPVPEYLVASSLSKFLELMRKRRYGHTDAPIRGINLFDATSMLAHDPALGKLEHLAQFPWEADATAEGELS